MRIAITGTHRVGKTTLAEKLLEYLPDYTFRKEPYYALEESGYEFSAVPDIDDFITQFNYAVAQWQGSEDKVILDRTPIDLLAYIYALDPTANIPSYYETAQSVVAATDLLVFVPVEEPDRIPFAPSDLPELRLQVDEILNDWVWDFGITTIEVKGTLQNRIDQVMDKVTSMR